MRHKRFFEMFGKVEFWKRGQVGREGFTVEQMYTAFKQRMAEENQEYRKLLDEFKDT